MAGVVVTLRVPAARPTPASTGLRPSTLAPSRAITDSNGRFLFTDLPAGQYAFSISTASGDLLGGYGMRRPGGAPQTFELADGQRAGDVTLRAWRYGAVAGRVVDQDGEPIVETRVTLLRVEIVAGHRRYRVGPTTMTDDRGMYRISWVAPGEYTAYLPYTQVTVPVEVQAAYDSASSKGQVIRLDFERTYGLASSNVNGSGLRIGDHLLIRESNSYGGEGQIGPSFMSPPPDASGRVSVYPMTFYPNVTALSEAATFTVESGQDRAGTDLQARLVPAVQISGQVVGIEGLAPMIAVRLIAQSATDADDENGFETARTVTNATGAFTFLGVPAGSYVVKVARVPNTTRPTTMTSVTVGTTTTFSTVDDSSLPPLPLPETPTESQSMPLAVGDEAIRNLTLQLQTGPRLSGSLVYDGASPPLTADQVVRVSIALDPVDGRVFPGAAGKGQFEANGHFRTLGLLPGRYMIKLAGNLGPWSLASVSVGEKGPPDRPIVISNTDVSGVVITLTDGARSITGAVRDAQGSFDAQQPCSYFQRTGRSGWT